MRACYCPPYYMTLQTNEEITFTNDTWTQKEKIFFMKPGCDLENQYQFGGVCETVVVPPGESLVFDPAKHGGPIESGGLFGYFKSRGMIVARIAKAKVEAMWVNAGEEIRASDFALYKEQEPTFYRDRIIPGTKTERTWTFSIDEFRKLSNNQKLFRRLTYYNNPREYRDRT